MKNHQLSKKSPNRWYLFGKNNWQRFFDYLVRNSFFRKIRLFWHKRVKPFFTKSLIIVLIFAIFLPLIYAKTLPSSFAKQKQQLIGLFNRKFTILSANKLKIDISGTIRSNKYEIENIVLSIFEESYLQNQISDEPLKKSVEAIKKSSSWIDEVAIYRKFPNVIVIKIVEYQPFVVWQNDGKKYVIDKNGHNIEIDKDNQDFDSIIVLSGVDAYKNVNSLFNLFLTDPATSQEVYSATWVSNRRWDIRFNNGVIVKLPESNLNEAWQKLSKIRSVENSFNYLKIIDLRVVDKIYIEYQ